MLLTSTAIYSIGIYCWKGSMVGYLFIPRWPESLYLLSFHHFPLSFLSLSHLFSWLSFFSRLHKNQYWPQNDSIFSWHASPGKAPWFNENVIWIERDESRDEVSMKRRQKERERKERYKVRSSLDSQIIRNEINDELSAYQKGSFAQTQLCLCKLNHSINL